VRRHKIDKILTEMEFVPSEFSAGLAGRWVFRQWRENPLGAVPRAFERLGNAEIIEHGDGSLHRLVFGSLLLLNPAT